MKLVTCVFKATIICIVIAISVFLFLTPLAFHWIDGVWQFFPLY